MSLDISLYGPSTTQTCQCSICNNVHTRSVRDTFFSHNITHNLGPMARACRLDDSTSGRWTLYEVLWHPEAMQVTRALDLIPFLTQSLRLLQAQPEVFHKFTPGNGWGTYADLVQCAQTYLQACRDYPQATVEVSR